MILFRGTGSAACRYLESERSRADDYYLEGGTSLASFTETDGRGEVLSTSELDADTYARWVDWTDPLTGSSMGKPRLPAEEGSRKKGSPRFAEMVVNAPKSLSIAAALHPEVSDALDAAQADAVAEIRRFLWLHSVTRVGPRGRQEVVPVERLQTVAVVHKTSRAGDPHRHVHFQIGTRAWAAGRWRGLDTAALFKQQGAIRTLGAAVIAAHPGLAQVLDRHGFTLDPVSGEVVELEPFNLLMSKRAGQVEKNLADLEAKWAEAHPGQEPGPTVTSRMVAAAWAKDRPQKRPSTLAHEDAWRKELADAGYDPDRIKPTTRPSRGADPPSPDDLKVVTIASRALDRCSSQASTWTRHSVAEHATRIITEHGVRGTPADLRGLVELATHLAVGDCLSVLPPGAARPEHVAHLTSLDVVAAETRLRDLLAERLTSGREAPSPDVTTRVARRGLDDAQADAAAAVASTNSLVIVEGAAGAGKTTMLTVAIEANAVEGRATRILTPTRKAAEVASSELGVPAESVAKLLHAHGWRWNADGVWSRLALGEPDPDTGGTYGGVPSWARLARGERVVVDEAAMLDQDSAIALLTLTREAGATVALVGDRAQLPAVGRGGVLDMAAALTTGSGRTIHDMDSVHRFADPAYADLTLRLRAGQEPERLFDRLRALGLVRLHRSAEDAHADIAATVTSALGKHSVAVTVATNDEARALNELIRAHRVACAEVNDTTTVAGSDRLPIGRGDVITTRKNDNALGVANRQAWTVQDVGSDGTVWAIENTSPLKHRRSVALPSSYVGEHVHLGYAATAYGVQGVTTTTAHTQLSEALDASGVYVGMTRGRDTNVLHIVAENLDEAREQFIGALQLDRADRGLQRATTEAQAAVAGLAADGPVKLVNDERARLVAAIAEAEREAARWERAASSLSAQAEAHAREEAATLDTLTVAEAHLTSVQSEAMESLLPQAVADGQAYIDAHEQQAAAWKELNSVGRLGRRAANRRLKAVNDEVHKAQERANQRWGSLPSPSKWDANTRDGLEPWAGRVASEHAESHPLVSAALRQVEECREQQGEVRWRHQRESADLRLQVYGRRDAASHRATAGTRSAASRAERWRLRVDAARADLAQIESLPVGRALEFIEARRERIRQVESARAETLPRRRCELLVDRERETNGPELGLGI